MRENLHHLQQQVRAFVVDGQDSDLALGEAEAFADALIRDATLQKEIHFWGRLEPMPHSSIEDHDMTTFKEFDVLVSLLPARQTVRTFLWVCQRCRSQRMTTFKYTSCASLRTVPKSHWRIKCNSDPWWCEIKYCDWNYWEVLIERKLNEYLTGIHSEGFCLLINYYFE